MKRNLLLLKEFCQALNNFEEKFTGECESHEAGLRKYREEKSRGQIWMRFNAEGEED
jgi:hypothetical protein